MPSTIQTSWRTKQVTTYGRRNRNVVPVFDTDDLKTTGNAESTSYVEDALLSPENVQLHPKPKAKRLQNLVASHGQGSTLSPASSKRHSARGVPLYYDGAPSPRRPSISVTPGRVPLASKGDANAFDSPRVEAIALNQKFVNTFPARKPTKKALTLKHSSGLKKGLPPSPIQRNAPQKVEIIDINSEGETVHVEVRQKKARLKSTARMARIIVSDDSVEETEDDSFDEHQVNMPWNTGSHSSARTQKSHPSLKIPVKEGTIVSRGNVATPTVSRHRDLGALGALPALRETSKPRTKPSRPSQPPATSSKSHVFPSSLSTAPSTSVDQSSSCVFGVPMTNSSDDVEYLNVVEEILSLAPSSVRVKYSTRPDPRVLFPHAGSPRQRKILSKWLEAHYFIPQSPDAITIAHHEVLQLDGQGDPLPKGHASAPSGGEALHKQLKTARLLPPLGRSAKTLEVANPPTSQETIYVSSSEDEGIGRPIARGRVIDISSDTSDSMSMSRALDDITNQVQALHLPSGSSTSSAPPIPPSKLPSAFVALLDVCHQTEAFHFSAFVETFPFDQSIHGKRGMSSKTDTPFTFRKIGEASFSEVFRVGDVVLKIVPIAIKPSDRGPIGGSKNEAPWPSVSDPGDVLREILATKVMGEVHSGFIKLLKTYVLCGRYPKSLLEEWDAFDERKGSQSISPAVLPDTQHYVVILLPHGGSDLEAQDFALAQKKMRNAWRQCASVFWQVCTALAVAEQAVSFEHRDLHWGQILVDEVSRPSTPGRRSGRTAKISNSSSLDEQKFIPMNSLAHGVKATIIDFGLSRMNIQKPGHASSGITRNSRSGGNRGHDAGEVPQFTEFEEVIFEGEGDYQFDIYRMMRKHNGDDWAKFSPLSNVMWLHYLVLQLLNGFRLRPPAVQKKASTVGFSERDCWNCLVEAEQLVGKALKKPRKIKGKMASEGSPFGAACDVLQWGKSQGWVL